MQGTQFQALVQEDPTCCGATKPVRHNYWACALERLCLEPVLHNRRSHRNEKPAYHNKELPPLATIRESPRAAMKTQRSQKKHKKTAGLASHCYLPRECFSVFWERAQYSSSMG